MAAAAVGALLLPVQAAYAAPLLTTDLTTGLTGADLASALVGAGVTVSNASHTGADVAAGTFSGGTGVIGFEDGIILSSGDIANVVGPNDAPSTTTNSGQPGDADLTTLSGFNTNDASVLEFDFEVDAGAESVFFQYVFASEEYNEYVETSYNDVFGFFVNDTNCALIGADPVSINTVNAGKPGVPATNPDSYINNDPFHATFGGTPLDPGDLLDTEMDGLTTVLTCEAPVDDAGTNTMKLAIADASDFILDSNVFIQAGSLTTVPPPPEGECVDLIAGQDLDVGEVCVSGDADEMTVTYSTDDGWVLVQTHLHVADDEAGVPQTKNGNPIPGKFDHSDPHGSTTEYSYTFDPEDFDDWTIAAHAVVEKIDTGVELAAAGYWADTVVDSDQGTRKDGSPVLAERSDPSLGLVGDAQTENTFYSLGFGGSITVGFECPIPNLDGDDLSVIEITGGTYPPETALVEAWDPHTGMWVELGTADNSANPTPDRQTASTFDLGGIMYTSMIRITDTTDASLHDATADGFDLDGVQSLQACHPILHESAWGDGTEFAFDGKGSAPEGNWGMYFTYPFPE